MTQDIVARFRQHPREGACERCSLTMQLVAQDIEEVTTGISMGHYPRRDEIIRVTKAAESLLRRWLSATGAR